jgi:hypothetical protein
MSQERLGKKHSLMSTNLDRPWRCEAQKAEKAVLTVLVACFHLASKQEQCTMHVLFLYIDFHEHIQIKALSHYPAVCHVEISMSNVVAIIT